VADEAVTPGGIGFLDASRHLKENLRFLLRSANVHSPFAFVSNLRTDGQPWNDIYPSYVGSPETYYARPSSPTNYEYSGFRIFSSTLNAAVLRERRPIEDHFLWRNFVYDPADFDTNWSLTNGASVYDPWWPIRLLEDPKYQVIGPATNPLPLAFSSTNSPWLMGRGVYCGWWPCGPETLGEVGLEVLESEQFLLPGGVRNVYGLPLLSVQFPPTPTLVAGGPAEWLMVSTLAYPEAAVPDLSTADYYFVSQTPYFRFGSARPPLPGSPDFTVTNTSPLLIASVGQLYAVAGWAKQAILNGYANRFGYLEQYFDKAYGMTDGGVVTTNQTGLLSPYGEFFPTEPWPTALVTMPDIETGQRGTGIVHVIKLRI
jgi:hypothetical protein